MSTTTYTLSVDFTSQWARENPYTSFVWRLAHHTKIHRDKKQANKARPSCFDCVYKQAPKETRTTQACLC